MGVGGQVDSEPLWQNGWQGGWLSGARHCASPNFDARPEGMRPDLLVIHNISLPPDDFSTNAIEQFFTNTLDWDAHPYFETIRDVRVSAHFLIRRNGRLIQFVSCDDRAWHAGFSCFQGRERCNDFSIGIELEGSDTQAFEISQYQTLAILTRALAETYPVRAVVGHSDIAPDRKTDPGPYFDWPQYRSFLPSQIDTPFLV